MSILRHIISNQCLSSTCKLFFLIKATSSSSRPLYTHHGHFFLTKATSSSHRAGFLPYEGHFFLIGATSYSSRPLLPHQGHIFLINETSSLSNTLLPHQDNTFLYTSRQLINALFFFLHHGHSSPINLPLYTYKCSQTGKDCRHKEKWGHKMRGRIPLGIKEGHKLTPLS